MSSERSARPQSRGRRRRPVLKAVVFALLAAGIFMLGVALGQATKSNPARGPATTQIRTIVPVPATVTVTTTVTGEP